MNMLLIHLLILGAWYGAVEVLFAFGSGFIDGYSVKVLVLLCGIIIFLFHWNIIKIFFSSPNRDLLTKIPNQYELRDYLKKAMARLDQRSFAVLYLDFDRIKAINDSIGHAAGDRMLEQAAQRMIRKLRPSDFVARLAGDAFVVVRIFARKGEVIELADRLADEFKRPLNLDGEELFTKVSIGISVYPEDGDEIEDLLRKADKAMYAAKEKKLERYKFFGGESIAMLKRDERRVRILAGLKRAIANEEMSLSFQPQIHLSTGKLVGLEALLRWRNAELGDVPPSEFIPLAEEFGMIHEIGKWALAAACKQSVAWQRAGFEPVAVSVNVSVRQFQDQFFVRDVRKILASTGLKPEYLHIEITESTMQNFEETREIIESLKRIGVKISVDDFGTGYSSLHVLNQLPIDILKIDRAFVQHVADDDGAACLVKTIIDMGRSLGFELVAEGIEEKEQISFLVHHNCLIGQGFYFSKPISSPDVEFWFQVAMKGQESGCGLERGAEG